MPALKVNGSFISEKVSKIRWIPEQYTVPDSFVTGSWDFPVNSVKVWQLQSNNLTDDAEIVPKCTASKKIHGDVTGLEFIDANNIAVSSTDGCVRVLHLNRNIGRENLTEEYCQKDAHHFENNVTAPCNALSTFEHNIASVGEDGRLNVLNINGNAIIRTINNADSCSLTCVTFINHKEVISKMYYNRDIENIILIIILDIYG